MGFGDPFGGFMNSFIPVFFIVIFVIVIGSFIFAAVRGITKWNYNNSQPVLTVIAKIITKRSEVSRSSHFNNSTHTHHHNTTTWYYVTFEVESGDRMELQVHNHEYGLLAEDDIGKLTFQGSRFLSFNRSMEDHESIEK